MTSFSLAGRQALVTGASRGIGAALALGLAAAGADVAVTARRIEDLAATSVGVDGLGRKSLPIACDVTQVASIAAAAAAIAGAGWMPDILVNNAGVERVSPSADVDEATWDSIVDTNLKGAFFVAQAFARPLIARGAPGAIVNVCSLTSGIGIPTATPYTSSKSGLLGMTRALAAEWAAHGIRVNGIGPGYFRTAMTEGFYQDTGWQDEMLAKIPMRRFGHLDDLVGATVFLASGAAAYITGQLLYIDGGYMASI
jgi:NAD(P)-dependent dehydrogenase (short-subunit alcohol dehydrogenase family)